MAGGRDQDLTGVPLLAKQMHYMESMEASETIFSQRLPKVVLQPSEESRQQQRFARNGRCG